MTVVILLLLTLCGQWFIHQKLLVCGKYLNTVEFNALYEFYNSTNGDYWVWPSDQDMQGAVRWDFSSPQSNNPCNKFWYGAPCYINSCQIDGSGCHIFALTLNTMNLTGTLPRSLNVFSELRLFDLGGNHINGSLVTINATKLSLVNVSHNCFSRINDDFLVHPNAPALLYLSYNCFHQPFPSFIYSMTSIQYLSLGYNDFTGSLGEEIGDLIHLQYLSVSSTKLNGTIPLSLCKLQNLEVLYLNNNSFTGNFLSSASSRSEVASTCSLPNLKYLWIAANAFSGYFPPLCDSVNISYISIYDNLFSGSLPNCWNQLKHLQVLQVQQNKFKGDSLQNVFNPTIQTRLEYVDLSDNAFSSQFPSNIFHLPSLKSIAAVKNCFEGSIPSTICESSPLLSVIALDGMRASSECLHYLWDPLQVTTGYYADQMEGKIPDCIWSLPNITVLHLSGNGLAGSLGDMNSSTTKLRDVALNHNRLRDKLPIAFQKIPFTNLDLSYNKLLGSIESLDQMTFNTEDNDSNQGAQLKLFQNRFSGKLPPLRHAYGVDVLDGNLFTCAKDPLPKHDPHYDTYVCGSQEFDEAATSFSSVLAVSVGLFIAFLFFINSYDSRHGFDKIIKSIIAVRYALQFSRSLFNFDRLLKTQGLDFDDFAIAPEINGGPTTLRRSSLLSFRLSEEIHQLKIDMDSLGRYRNVYKFLSILSLMRATCLWIAAFAIIFCLPVYIGFYTADPNNPALYSTHEQRYAWITTSAYLTGSTPAMVILALWIIILSIVLSRVIWHFNIHNRQTTWIMKILEWLKGNICGSFCGPTRREESPLEDSLLIFEDDRSSDASADAILREVDKGDKKNKEGGEKMISGKKKGNKNRDNGVELSPSSSSSSLLDHGSEDESRRSSFLLTLPKVRLCFCDLKYWSMYVLIVVVNIVVCMSVNIGYLQSQNNDNYSPRIKNFIQFAMAGFKVTWGMVAIRTMISFLPFNQNSNTLHVLMLLWNGIIAPCLATAFTDQSCFQDFFTGCSEVSATYSVPICQSFYQEFDTETYQVHTSCELYNEVSFTTSYTPAFIYYYACGAKLLTLYIPVYIYIYTILFVAVPLSLCIQAKVKKVWLPKQLRYFMIKGILRPAAAYQKVDFAGQLRSKQNAKDYSMLIRGDSIQVIQINHLVILMTFGLASPILAIIMALAIIADTFAWQLVIIRFFKYGDPSSPFSRQSDELLKQQQLNQNIPIQNQYGPADGRLTAVGKIPSPLVVSGVRNCVRDGDESSSSGSCRSAKEGSSISSALRISDSDGGYDREEDDPAEDNIDQEERGEYDEGDEEDRLGALDKCIGETWVCLKNNKWIILYCSMFFYAFVLFDMVGDEGGWKNATWMVFVILLLMVVMRLLLLDIAIVLFQTLLRYTRVPRHSILSSWSVGSIE